MPEASPLPQGGATRSLPVRRDAAASGPENMAADEALAAESLARGVPLMRLYGWQEPTVSLGAFQPVAAARAAPAIAGLPLVRRPSGGGAIVHGSDVTYALSLPAGHPLASAAEPLYAAVHGALVEALAAHGIAARMHGGGGGGDPDSFFCFERRATVDVVVARPGRPASADDPKILGSAQRRLRGAVLQHGSLLLGTRGAAPGPRHPALSGIHPSAPAVDDLVADWLRRVAVALGMNAPREEPPTAERPGFAALVARFQEPRWLERR